MKRMMRQNCFKNEASLLDQRYLSQSISVRFIPLMSYTLYAKLPKWLDAVKWHSLDQPQVEL